MTTKPERIRTLNDKLRQHPPCGIAVMTPGIAALGQVAIDRIIKTIAVFDDFCHANDPHQEPSDPTRGAGTGNRGAYAVDE